MNIGWMKVKQQAIHSRYLFMTMKEPWSTVIKKTGRTRSRTSHAPGFRETLPHTQNGSLVWGWDGKIHLV